MNQITFGWCIPLFKHCWVQFASFLLRTFLPMFMRDIGLPFSFPAISLSGYSIKVILALQNELGSVSSAFILAKKKMQRISMISSFNAWQNLPVKPSLVDLRKVTAIWFVQHFSFHDDGGDAFCDLYMLELKRETLLKPATSCSGLENLIANLLELCVN